MHFEIWAFQFSSPPSKYEKMTHFQRFCEICQFHCMARFSARKRWSTYIKPTILQLGIQLCTKKLTTHISVPLFYWNILKLDQYWNFPMCRFNRFRAFLGHNEQIWPLVSIFATLTLVEWLILISGTQNTKLEQWYWPFFKFLILIFWNLGSKYEF